MGKATRKHYGADSKSNVALGIVRHGIHQTMIAAWKRQAIGGSALTFSGKAEAVSATGEAEVTRLHAKIGQLVVERDVLARASGRWA